MVEAFDRMYKVLKERMSIDQLILFYAYSKKSRSTSIEELTKKLSLPRSTMVDHLRFLVADGFLKEEKEGRTKVFYPVAEIADKFFGALANLSSAYVISLDQIRKTELKELRDSLKGEDKSDSDRS